MDIVTLLEGLVNGLIEAEEKFLNDPKDFYSLEKSVKATTELFSAGFLTSAADSLNPIAVMKCYNLIGGYFAYFGLVALIENFLSDVLTAHGFYFYVAEFILAIVMLMLGAFSIQNRKIKKYNSKTFKQVRRMRKKKLQKNQVRISSCFNCYGSRLNNIGTYDCFAILCIFGDFTELSIEFP